MDIDWIIRQSMKDVLWCNAGIERPYLSRPDQVEHLIENRIAYWLFAGTRSASSASETA